MSFLFLAHHGEAVAPDVDHRRPLTTDGVRDISARADEAAARGVVPDVIWHSGKLRARQTAEIYWTRCAPLAAFSAARGLLPDDPPFIAKDLVAGETRTIMLVGHMPHLRRLLGALVADAATEYPLHALIALESEDSGETWRERWRIVP